MDFAPYQDQSPERTRALSPPPQDGRRSGSFSPAPQNAPASAGQPSSRPTSPPIQSSRDTSNNTPAETYGNWSNENRDLENGGNRSHINEFETSLPLRLDYEAMLAYLLLPPAGGVFLLLIEHKSDYVR
jgi:hypothetical protein